MDHLGLHKLEYQRLIKIRECLTNIKGLIIEEHADPTGNPITRLRIYIDHNVSGLDIGKLVKALRSGSPPIIVRDHHIDLGYFEIDPCNMKDGDPEIVISFFKDLQPLLLNCTPEFKENNTLGPRNSRYDNKGIPVINLSEVPFTYHRDIDREDHFKKWPESFQKNASTEN